MVRCTICRLCDPLSDGLGPIGRVPPEEEILVQNPRFL